MTTLRVLMDGGILRGKGLVDVAPPSNIYWDWSASNLPWNYKTSAEWEQRLPAGIPVVDLSSTGSTFLQKLTNTVNAQSGRFICRLPAGRHMLTAFNLIGTSGDVTYAFGFWFTKLAGFVGPGPDLCSIEMAPNSMSQAQLDAINARPYDFNPLQISLCRIDLEYNGGPSQMYLGGLSFRAADQQNITQRADPAMGFSVPTPAPHGGVVLYGKGSGTGSHVRFQAAGRGLMDRPPFECANVGSQYSSVEWFNCEFDGRRAPEIDSARPARCGGFMVNNETLSRLTDSWIHDLFVSRYAANDQNRDTQGLYELIRVKIEKNVAADAGWESTNGRINIIDCIMSQDYLNNFSQHLSLTTVGNRNPQGGRMRVERGVWRTTAFPQLDGYLTVRAVSNTYWYMDGLNTTITAINADGNRLQPWTTTSWPPSAATLAAAGVTPKTHYIVRTN